MATPVMFCGRNITVKTLTVSDVRELLDEMQKAGEEKKTILEQDVIDLLFDDEVTALAMAKATGLTTKELGGNVPPDDVRKLIDAVRAENPFFVGMMERLITAGKGGGGADLVPSLKPSVT